MVRGGFFLCRRISPHGTIQAYTFEVWSDVLVSEGCGNGFPPRMRALHTCSRNVTEDTVHAAAYSNG